MAVNPLKLTFYKFTGYNPNDEPASEAVIESNAHFDLPLLLKEYEPIKLSAIKVSLTDAEIEPCDYLKITDIITGERFYYYIVNNSRINEKVIIITVRLDAFATVGLENISFLGSIARRSLSAAERENYPRLPEPWAPRRPLKTRRVVIDLNVGKVIRIPSHISTTFEEEETEIEESETIEVPNSPLGLSTFEDSLSISALLPVGYPTPAADTTHTVTTPWGTLTFTTPYETYFNLSGNALSTFLMKAKKYNALDLIESPYYLPSPSDASVSITEFGNPETVNKKAYKFYTTMTVRSLASNQSKTYDDNNADLQANQTLNVIVVPDKTGGFYVLPSTIRDTGLNAYTFLDGVYSPFESVLMNAVGDTPAKFAADGTNILNSALNDLFQTYINKINAIQYEGMQAKYFKDMGSVKSVAMAFLGEVIGYTSTTESAGGGYWQNAVIQTAVPATTQTQNITQKTSGYTQNQSTTSRSDGYNVYSNLYVPTHNQTINTRQTPGTLNSVNTVGNTTIPAHYENTTIKYPAISTTTNGTINVPNVTTTITGNITTAGYSQNTYQNTYVTGGNQQTRTTVNGSTRSIATGANIAEQGAGAVYEVDGWSTLKTILFGGYRNEVHSFMLGNINDYINRWVAIQNDLHNGRVANLFKNITLLGTYQDYNKFAGKYEILITSLQPEDEHNFDLFLSHFGHAVDEYATALVTDAGGNFNYTMVGDDAVLTNSVAPDLSAQILNQFRTGVRVWKTLVRPENY